MAINDNKTAMKSVRQRNYLARDFDGFRSALLDYARQYYPDRIQDFSESSVGGLFLDMAAYIGDNMSFYLDHLYGELNNETVVETGNIERILRSAGVSITGASTATAEVDFYIEVPLIDGTMNIDTSLVPTIEAGTVIRADGGINFTLVENVQFWQVDTATGKIVIDPLVDKVIGRRSSGTPVSMVLKKRGVCSTGDQTTETFNLGSFVPFRRLTLSQPNVTQIISVVDGLGNSYYEVESLTNDVVYRNVLDTSDKTGLVKDTLKVVPAPYRFVKEVSLSSRQSTIVMGGGTADNLEDDIIPDPSEFSIPLPFSQTFSRVPVNPQKMLQTSTLGVSAQNTALTVTYRYGGGLSHNVPANTIRSISQLNMSFPANPPASQQFQIRNSTSVTNELPARGGEDAPTAETLLALVPSLKNSQERMVTKEDILARVYTMPSNFGRVFRAAVLQNPNNPLAANLYVISRDIDNNLVISPDGLKRNLARYLNTYRMISDSIDIKDAAIINLELLFEVIVDPSLNKSTLLKSIITDLKNQLDIKNMHIGRPIIVTDVEQTIYAKPGVVAVSMVKFNGLSGTVNNKQYSQVTFDPRYHTKNKIIYPLDGSIFEIKYPDINIVGRAVSSV